MTFSTSYPEIRPAVVTVGDELIYGERSNANLEWMLQTFTRRGMPAHAALVLPDSEEAIARHLRYLKERGHRPIFVSGGIGGTHDDRTRQGIAGALGRPLVLHEECDAILSRKYGSAYTPERRRMASLPRGARLIPNPIGAPGFFVDPIYAFPGFPEMLHPMAEKVLNELFGIVEKTPFVIREIRLPVGEGTIAAEVESFDKTHPDVEIGLYPRFTSTGPEVTVRCRYRKDSEPAQNAVRRFLDELEKRYAPSPTGH